MSSSYLWYFSEEPVTLMSFWRSYVIRKDRSLTTTTWIQRIMSSRNTIWFWWCSNRQIFFKFSVQITAISDRKLFYPVSCKYSFWNWNRQKCSQGIFYPTWANRTNFWTTIDLKNYTCVWMNSSYQHASCKTIVGLWLYIQYWLCCLE